MLVNVSDAVNPFVPHDAAAQVAAPPSAFVVVAKRGALLTVLLDGETGYLTRVDLSAAFADLSADERTLLEDVFEEAVEAALQHAGALTPAAVAAALEQAIGALGVFGLGHHAHRLAAALAQAEERG